MKNIRIEWVENGTPKHRTADALIYQMHTGDWGVERGIVRIVLAKEGGSNVAKMFLQKRDDRWARQARQAKKLMMLAGIVALAGLVMLL